MTSTAIGSQFSTFAIGSVAGAPKPITGVSLGYPAIVTAVGHGFANGDVVSLAAILGMLAMNGRTAVVQYASADKFALAGVDSSAFPPYVSGGTVTGIAWTPIANIKTFSGFDGSAATIDISNLESVAKEYLMGLKDLGKFSLELDYDSTDPGQMALLAAQSAQAKKQFKLTLPDNSTATFTGLVLKATAAGAVEQEIKRSVDIQISGDSVWA